MQILLIAQNAQQNSLQQARFAALANGDPKLAEKLREDMHTLLDATLDNQDKMVRYILKTI